MHSLIKIFADKKRATIFILFLGLLYGYFSYLRIAKEDKPDVKIPTIYVVAQNDGMSPEDSERLLVRPLENSLKNISGIKKLESYAHQGSATIFVEFYPGSNNEKALSDVRAQVNDAESKLPATTKKPIVQEINLSLLPILNVVLISNDNIKTLMQNAKNLRDKIEGIKDVLSVKIGGVLEDVVEILIDKEKLEFYNINLQKLISQIGENNRFFNLGKIKTKNGEFSIKIHSSIDNAMELKSFPVLKHKNSVIKLGDIAEINRTFKDPSEISRVNGKKSIVLQIQKRTGSNIISTIKSVKSLIENEKEFLPKEITVLFSHDESSNISNMITELENGILIAVILVISIIAFSVGIRSAIIVALSIPTSFLFGVLVLDLSGYTLNKVVLFTLILTVGMIVDDAIVVSEYADRKIIQGTNPKDAFIISASRMFWPILTSTVVKILVFLPLLFWPGVIGQFMKYMPITVFIILTNSLLFALFFQPSFGSFFLKKNIDPSIIKSVQASENGNIKDLKGLSKKYYNLLNIVLNAPRTFVSIVFLILIGIILFFITIGTGIEFFPKIEPKNAIIAAKTIGNLSLEEKSNILYSIENKLENMSKEIKIFYAKSTSSENNPNLPEGTIATIELELEDWKKRRKAKYIFDDIRKKLENIVGVEIEILEQREGPPSLKPLEINFSSRDFDLVSSFTKKIMNMMRKDADFTNIETSENLSGIDWKINFDRELLAIFNIGLNDIANSISLLSDGLNLTTFTPNDAEDEVDIVLRFKPNQRKISMIDNFNISNKFGEIVSMKNFAKKVATEKINSIYKIDRKRILSIKANIRPDVLLDKKIQELKKWLDNNIDGNIKYTFQGDTEQQKESSDFLYKAFITAIVMMFLVMLIQFNSFYHTIIIMSSVFLSTTGVLLGLILTWQPFGIVMCGIGVIALSGIVLNNNILFIDTYQNLRKEGFGIEYSIIRSGVQRMRPILLTASTAILGLMPMVFGLTINITKFEIFYDSPSSQWWRQLSTSIAGGLAFATILTLFFTPCLLLIGKRFDPFKKDDKKI